MDRQATSELDTPPARRPTAAGPAAPSDAELDALLEGTEDAGKQADDVLATADAALQSELDELFDELGDEAAAAPADVDDNDPGEAVLDQELDALFNDLAAEPAEEVQEASDEASVEQEEAPEVAAEPTDPAPVDEPVDTVVAESPEQASDDAIALQEELADEEPALHVPVRNDPDNEPATANDDRPTLPWWHRALVLMNRPFASLPAQTRDVLGKIAVVTLANALALLIYAALLRG